MTETKTPPTETRKEMLKRVGTEAVLSWSIKGGIAFFAAAIVYLFTPTWDKVTALMDVPARIDMLEDTVADLREEVIAFRVPEDFILLSPTNTGPVDGYCVENAPCAIRVRIRRADDAISCTYIKGTGRYGFWDRAADGPAWASIAAPVPERNLGARWETIPIVLNVPNDLAPESDFFIEGQYQDCPGQREGQTVTGQSNFVPMEIRSQDQ